MLCIKLEDHLDIPLYYIMIPLWIFLPLSIADLARELRRGRCAQ